MVPGGAAAAIVIEAALRSRYISASFHEHGGDRGRALGVIDFFVVTLTV